MEPKDYVISKIEGEYAHLKDVESGEELFIAMALLPLGVDVGRNDKGNLYGGRNTVNKRRAAYEGASTIYDSFVK